MDDRKKIRWAPKLRREKLAALYRSSAAGMLDEELLADVGIALWLRCEAIVMIGQRELFCPACRERLRFAEGAGDEDSAVCGCGYSVRYADYHASYRHQDLWQGNAADPFTRYYQDYPRLRTPGEQIVAIDTLIHAFHTDAKLGLPNRAAGNNLIEGSLRDVVAFLDTLSGMQPEADAAFRETVDLMWRRRHGQI